MNKWDAIIKKPTKLPSMFTGYHSTPALIQLAFNSAGLTDKKLSALRELSQEECQKLVHRLVDEFLRLRFPVLLALNKADSADAKTNIEKFQEKFKDGNIVPVSAKSECYLQEKDKEGTISYSKGMSDYTVNRERELEDSCDENLSNISKNVLSTYGNTGVLAALCLAVQLRSPLHTFPVHCLDTYQSINVNQRKEVQVLRDCVVIKPGTTVGKLFDIMSYPPICLLAGEYVRAECVDATGRKQVLHKEEIITESNSVLKIMSTKKAAQPSKSRN